MKKSFKELSVYMKTFFISFGTGFAVSLILFILGLLDILSLFIPLGIILGSLFSAFSYFFLGRIDNMGADYTKKSKWTMAVIYIRLFLLLAFMAVEVLFQLKLEIVLFNPFGFLGAYLFTSIVFGVLYFRSKKC